MTLVAFQTDLRTSSARNARRERAVPEDILARQFDSAEFPYADEAHALIVVR